MDDAEILIERVFDAPRALVFRNWTDAQQVAAWFAPDGYTVVSCSLDARAGGHFRVVFRSDTGDAHTESGEFLELEAPSKLRFSLTQADDRGRTGPRTIVAVELAESGPTKTTMRFRQTGFTDAKAREGNAQGWQECFRKLDTNLAAEREVRAVFEKWWRDSSAKDLDAVMASIAHDALSYEHEMPIQHRGVDAIRPVCARGFQAMPDPFRWDVPDLQVIVRGDIAVTWGLNHMRGGSIDSWSRGTRVFQRINGAWMMIHQHVSFPFDPATGKIVTERPPA